ncbi:MAG: gluconate 2-dehydrogenase subunit 3 family protein [Bacteroidota bacterium]
MAKQPISRRDSLKYLAAGSLGTGLALTGCEPQQPIEETPPVPVHTHDGQTFDLNERDQKLMEVPFFDAHETATVKALADMIIPADERSGSASDAGVVEFIDFMMKDQPIHQIKMRGGLKWLDTQCLHRFDKPFIGCVENEMTEILDQIAYPEVAEPEMSQGVAFFNLFRDFVASGFWTSRMGIDDLQYMGNVGNIWDGPPEEWLKRLGVEDMV